MQTQRLPDDARRILGAYNRAVLEASQRTVLRTYAMASEKPAPRTLKGALTKPGDQSLLGRRLESQ